MQKIFFKDKKVNGVLQGEYSELKELIIKDSFDSFEYCGDEYNVEVGMYHTSVGYTFEPDFSHEKSIIDAETKATILSKYDEIEQANIMRLAMVEMYKAMQGLPTDNDIVAQALEANAFIESIREAGRQKKSDIMV